MTDEELYPKTLPSLQIGRMDIRQLIISLVCGIIIGVVGWYVDPSSSLVLGQTTPEDSAYNLLVQGFEAGQLNLKKEAPPELAHLADPYNPALNGPYLAEVADTSYYHGKLYTYFGVVPVLVLFWPYHALTGVFLSEKAAAIIFFVLGFLFASELLYAIRRQYFPEVKESVVTIGTFGLGLSLVLTLYDNIYQVAIASGFAFSTLSLVAIWRAMHDPNRRALWLLLASFAYGLAVGSRPSLLFGAIILLIPILQIWRNGTLRDSWRKIGISFIAAVGPLVLVGTGLMIYNDLRFDNPFEFGWRYELNVDFQPTTAHQFSLHYFWFDFHYYFLELFRWHNHFPFLQSVSLSRLPQGYDPRMSAPCGGVLSIYPVVLLALAVPLSWRNKQAETIQRLLWFELGVILLFTFCALTMCFYLSATSRYCMDFLPALLILAMIGFFNLQRAYVDSPVWWRVASWTCSFLIVYSIAFNILMNVEFRGGAELLTGNYLYNKGRLNEAIEHYQRALRFGNESADTYGGLGLALVDAGQTKEGVIQLRKALEIEPGKAKTYSDLGYGLIKFGQIDDAIIQFKKVLDLEPNNAKCKYEFGKCLVQTGKADEGLIYIQKALEMDPKLAKENSPLENNNLAWSFATDPEKSRRNGKLAVDLAEDACNSTQYQVTAMVGTLAAAYAEADRFQDAISTAQKAITLARQKGESNLVSANEGLLALYQEHKPFHESRPAQGN